MMLNICKIGLIPYGEALKLQYEIVEARLKDRIGNTLLLLEHPAVLTKGTRTDAANIYLTEEQLANNGISVYEVNRGGDVTYHGPGQIVGYPFVQLKDLEMGVREFIQTLEASLIDLLHDEYGIEAHPLKDKFTGVWVGDRKITAFGLAVQHGVTMHGFAFNVNTDLNHFNMINPCGLSRGVTSIEEELGHKVDMNRTIDLVAESIADHFRWVARYIDPDELRKMINQI